MNPAALAPTALHKLLVAEGKSKRCIKGQVIRNTGGNKNFNLIRSGYIKRYLITNEGSLSIEAIYGPGDVFSVTLAYKVFLNQDLYEGPETYYFEAMNECEIYTMDIGTLEQHFQKKPLFYRDLMLEAGKRIHALTQAVENIAMKTAQSRTAHQLLYYAKHFGRKKRKGIEIGIPLTHQDLANILSLSRETVSVSCTALQNEGLISGTKHIRVLDMDKLEEAAYS